MSTPSAAPLLAGLIRSQQRPERWHTCRVSKVNGDGTVDLLMFGAVVDHVTCLNGFVPSVGDLVLVLVSRDIGLIVLGRIPRRVVEEVSTDA